MRKVYFGNANKQLWIPAPQTGMQSDSSTRIDESQLLSGRSAITRSGANSRRFSTSWLGSLNAPEIEDSLHTIKDFYDGTYGDGPFYWNDPYATTSNLLPPHWAAPGLARKDWPGIGSFAATAYPETDANINDYPAYSARYNMTSTGAVSSSRKLTLIIPEGYTLHFGWHGVVDSGDGGIRIDRHSRSSGAVTSVDPNVIAVTSSNRTNVAISGDAYSRIDIYIHKPSGSVSDITVSGMIAQLLKGSALPQTGGFLGGRGTSSLEFASPVSIEYYSANINDGQVGLSVDWQEV
jgi:hypothetical protein